MITAFACLNILPFPQARKNHHARDGNLFPVPLCGFIKTSFVDTPLEICNSSAGGTKRWSSGVRCPRDQQVPVGGKQLYLRSTELPEPFPVNVTDRHLTSGISRHPSEILASCLRRPNEVAFPESMTGDRSAILATLSTLSGLQQVQLSSRDRRAANHPKRCGSNINFPRPPMSANIRSVERLVSDELRRRQSHTVYRMGLVRGFVFVAGLNQPQFSSEVGSFPALQLHHWGGFFHFSDRPTLPHHHGRKTFRRTSCSPSFG